MNNKKLKILFIPLGIGLAHTGRTIMVARELRKRGYNTIFAAGKDVSNIIEKEGFPCRVIPELSAKENLEKAKRITPNFYSIRLIKAFIRSELDIYKKEKPDLIISDMRITARLSSKIAKIPHVTINNANLTKYYNFSKAKFPIPIFFLNEFIPKRLLAPIKKDWMQKKVMGKIGSTLVNTVLVRQLLKFNIAVRKYKHKPIKSFYDLLTGDLTLICDAVFFRPMKKMPKNFKVIGPLFWNPKISLPSWSRKIDKSYKNKKIIIYITTGGTGDANLIKKIIPWLKNFPAEIVLTTGNTLDTNDLFNLKQDNLYISKILPGDWIMKRSNAIIFFAGNSTAYQALAYGVPQVVLPLHLDQQDNANQLLRLKTCVVLNPNKIDKKTFIQKLSLVLFDPVFKEKSLKYKDLLHKYNGPYQAADEIEKFMKIKRVAKKDGLIKTVVYRFLNFS